MLFYCLFQYFEEKEYQTESKQNETFGKVIFGTEAIQGTWSARQGINEEGTRQGARPRGAPSTLVVALGLPSSSFSFQYFLYFPEKFSVDFQRIPRTFISAQKQHHGSSAENSVRLA